jgi:hypothetical protein
MYLRGQHITSICIDTLNQESVRLFLMILRMNGTFDK